MYAPLSRRLASLLQMIKKLLRLTIFWMFDFTVSTYFFMFILNPSCFTWLIFILDDIVFLISKMTHIVLFVW